MIESVGKIEWESVWERECVCGREGVCERESVCGNEGECVGERVCGESVC